MANTEKTVKLKADGKVSEFTPGHAKALLAYPGTKWAEVKEEAPAKAVEAKTDKK